MISNRQKLKYLKRRFLEKDISSDLNISKSIFYNIFAGKTKGKKYSEKIEKFYSKIKKVKPAITKSVYGKKRNELEYVGYNADVTSKKIYRNGKTEIDTYVLPPIMDKDNELADFIYDRIHGKKGYKRVYYIIKYITHIYGKDVIYFYRSNKYSKKYTRLDIREELEQINNFSKIISLDIFYENNTYIKEKFSKKEILLNEKAILLKKLAKIDKLLK